MSTQSLYITIKFARMKVRKAKRKEKRKENKLLNHNNATWEENGCMRQNCEMGGTCEYPCKGDC